jgi:UDP-2,3-diacylglucosamine pyrophosphatase LpxH
MMSKVQAMSSPDPNVPAGKPTAQLPAAPPAGRSFRALFLSDFHLGTVGCKAPQLLDFLLQTTAETTYLVGDIFDNWRPLGAHWTEDHDAIVKLLIERARDGHRIVYLPGNHDAFFQRYLGRYFADLEIRAEAWHVTRGGERLLVTHGDTCDHFAHRLPILAKAGSWIEAGARRADWAVKAAARWARLPEWSGIERGIAQVNQAIRGYDRFEERLSALARERGADGIVCGHFHKPALHRDHGVLYANCGDWVENCSALAEESDGRLLLMNQTSGPSATSSTEIPLVPEVA